MQKTSTTEDRVKNKLNDFLRKSGKTEFEFVGTTNLIDDLGFKSREGLEFVLELCDEFDFDFASDFNPFVDDERRRGQTFAGLVRAIDVELATKGVANGKA